MELQAIRKSILPDSNNDVCMKLTNQNWFAFSFLVSFRSYVDFFFQFPISIGQGWGRMARRYPFKMINREGVDIFRWVSLSDFAERFRNFAERFRNRSGKFRNRSAQSLSATQRKMSSRFLLILLKPGSLGGSYQWELGSSSLPVGTFMNSQKFTGATPYMYY